MASVSLASGIYGGMILARNSERMSTVETLIRVYVVFKVPIMVPSCFTPCSTSLSCLSGRDDPPSATIMGSSIGHKTLLVESYHRTTMLSRVLTRLREDSDPLQILIDEGYWSRDHVFAIIKFLSRDARPVKAIQVFHHWMNMEDSRIEELNYREIILVLTEEGLVEPAFSLFKEMKNKSISPSVDIYNLIISGLAGGGYFEEVNIFLDELKESNLVPNAETYNALIPAYGKWKKYDDIGRTLKKMKSDGCSPNNNTYNMMVKEYAKAGLLTKMEKAYLALRTTKMRLEYSTTVSIIEGYAMFGLMHEMERFYRKLLNSDAYLTDDLIRKLAMIYIDKCMFSRLNELGIDLLLGNSYSSLGWCLRVLSQACLSNPKGLFSVLGMMKAGRYSWNVTIVNILLTFSLKQGVSRDFWRIMSRLVSINVKPDLVTLGVVCDANKMGFCGNGVFDVLNEMGFLDSAVDVKTDSVVLHALGKGWFLRTCEKMYCSLKAEARENKVWTYRMLIDLVAGRSRTSSSRQQTLEFNEGP